jgi:hypothetical protein
MVEVEKFLNSEPVPGLAICPRCTRKFNLEEAECDSCTTSTIAGGRRVPLQLWRRIPRPDGTVQILPPEAIPLKKSRPGIAKWVG